MQLRRACRKTLKEEAAWRKNTPHRPSGRKERPSGKGDSAKGLRKLGDPHDFAADYYRQGVDELLYMDIVASLYNRNNLSAIVRRNHGRRDSITVGGGLRSVDDAEHSSDGGDKAAINTAAIKDESIITPGGRGVRQPVHGVGHRGEKTPGRPGL